MPQGGYIYHGGVGLALGRQRESRTHQPQQVQLSLGLILIYVHIYTVTYIICKMIAFVSFAHPENARGESDNPNTNYLERNLKSRGLLTHAHTHVSPVSCSSWLAQGRRQPWSLVLKQKLQLLQGQAHSEFLLGHQVQELLQLIGEVLHSVHVQHLCPRTILQCFVEHAFASFFIS